MHKIKILCIGKNFNTQNTVSWFEPGTMAFLPNHSTYKAKMNGLLEKQKNKFMKCARSLYGLLFTKLLQLKIGYVNEEGDEQQMALTVVFFKLKSTYTYFTVNNYLLPNYSDLT